MPLYCCDRCGWATNGFRVEAAESHRADCPACAGTIRLTFHGGGPLPVDAFSRAAWVRRIGAPAPQPPSDAVDGSDVG